MSYPTHRGLRMMTAYELESLHGSVVQAFHDTPKEDERNRLWRLHSLIVKEKERRRREQNTHV